MRPCDAANLTCSARPPKWEPNPPRPYFGLEAMSSTTILGDPRQPRARAR